MLSPIHSKAWRGSLTMFAGYFNAHVADEIEDVSWAHAAGVIAPSAGPAPAPVKEDAPYFCGCLFKSAPYIGKTLERALAAGTKLEGKQRSSQHCTESSMLIYDFDAMSADLLKIIVGRLAAMRVAFLTYSTWSYGLPEKPGVRVRIIVPLDTPLDAQRSKSAWHGVGAQLFKDAKPDESSSRIYQQQGIWATAPDRAHLAFRLLNHGHVVCSQAAIDLCPSGLTAVARGAGGAFPPRNTPATITVQRLRDAIPWLDPEETPTWIANVTAFKATVPTIGESDAFALAAEYSSRGSAAATMNNDDSRYNPEAFFCSVNPAMPAEVAIATICGRARDTAREALESERGNSALSQRGREAALYLATHHRSLFETLRGVIREQNRVSL